MLIKIYLLIMVMARNQEYSTKLDEIINLIEQDIFDGSEGAIEKFDSYIKTIQDIGGFTTDARPFSRRQKVRSLGMLFGDKNATVFINKINSITRSEALDFIYSEIAWNWFNDDEYAFDIISKFIKEYPNNPEFHHSLSHVYEVNKDYIKAIKEVDFAIKLDQTNKAFIKTAFNKEKRYFDSLLKSSKFLEAEELIKNMLAKSYYKGTEWHNYIVDLSDRLEDHKLIDEKIHGIDQIIEEKSNKEKIKVIEIVSFFTAIISFVIINSNIAVKINTLKIATGYMGIMAGVLMLFVLGISLIISPNKNRFYKDWRVWFLVGISLFLSTIPCILEYMSKLISKMR